MNLTKQQQSIEKKLYRIYYDPGHPAGFGTLEKLYKSVNKKISRENILKWLQKQETYSRHKPLFINFQRNHYLIDNIDDLWESDLIVLNDSPTKKHNNNYGYIMGRYT